MKITRSLLFYLIAFAAVSYFLWQYLEVPRTIIISLIISLAIIFLLAYNKSAYTKPIGSILLIGNAIWLIGYFIPVYESEPDIRQRYRRNPSNMYTIGGGSGNFIVTLENNGRLHSAPATSFFNPQPVYQGNRITTAGSSSNTDDRIMVSFWDGSTLQIFPQSTVLLSPLSPDFASLSGSRIGIELEAGTITMYTRRKHFTPLQWFIKTNTISLSCKRCIVTYNGSRGSVASEDDITRWIAGGQEVTISGGTYNFQGNALRKSEDSNLLSVLATPASADSNEHFLYDTARNAFIRSQRGWTMDNSTLLGYLSKAKMAIIGLVDWTHRKKYDNLALYEYLRDNGEQVPPPFADKAYLYEFTQ